MEAIVKTERDELAIDLQAIETGLIQIRQFQALVQKLLVKDLDYGVIPGTTKPTLYKPGAEKTAKLMGLADSYEIIREIEDWEKPLFAYTVRCELHNIRTGTMISSGLGECNSYEGKYRYRWAWPNEVPEHLDKSTLRKKEGISKKGKPFTQYQIPNEDIFTQVNTVLKMSKKRALVDAVLSAARLSDIFTQDMEDIKGIATDTDDRLDPSLEVRKPPKPAPEKPQASDSANMLDQLQQLTETDILMPGDNIKLRDWLTREHFITDVKTVWEHYQIDIEVMEAGIHFQQPKTTVAETVQECFGQDAPGAESAPTEREVWMSNFEAANKPDQVNMLTAFVSANLVTQPVAMKEMVARNKTWSVSNLGSLAKADLVKLAKELWTVLEQEN